VDPSSTPWRALEDVPQRPAGQVESTPARQALPRTTLLAGGGAVLLAVAAFVLAFGSSSAGIVSVDGGAPLSTVASDIANPGASPGQLSALDGAGALIVEVVGAIARPGVYHLPRGSRVGDLVEAAGGYGPRVDAAQAGRDLNLAAVLRDGDQIRVPSRDDRSVATAARPSPGTGGASAPVDLNRATPAELDALPGIGPVTAAKIIASRDEQPFAIVGDLRTRKLVGEKTFATLKDLVSVR
jgi:competence protein ComEA